MADVALNKRAYRRFQDFLRTQEALTGRKVSPTAMQSFLEAELGAEQTTQARNRELSLREGEAEANRQRLQQQTDIEREAQKGAKRGSKASGVIQAAGTALKGYELYKGAGTAASGTPALPTASEYGVASRALEQDYGIGGQAAGGQWATSGPSPVGGQTASVGGQYALGTELGGATPASYSLTAGAPAQSAVDPQLWGTARDFTPQLWARSAEGAGQQGAQVATTQALASEAAPVATQASTTAVESLGPQAATTGTQEAGTQGGQQAGGAAGPVVQGVGAAVGVYFGVQGLREGHERGGMTGIGSAVGTAILPGVGTAVGAGVGYVVGTVLDVVGFESSEHTVICSELHRQGLLDTEVYNLDGQHRVQSIDDATYRGYLLWAKYVVKAMQKSQIITGVIAPIGRAWAYEMAHRIEPAIPGTVIGKGLMLVGVPLCRFLGRRIK